jgi:hypothetical protein
VSYGLPLLGILALAVLLAGALVAAVLPIAVRSPPSCRRAGLRSRSASRGGRPTRCCTDRYWDGIAKTRPFAYWAWGNLGALLVSAGPLLGAGLAVAARRHTGPARTVAVLAGAAALTVVIADLSRMSKAEVERIWLPFVPWLTLSLALLPGGWRRCGLALQVLTALVVEHALYTSW